MPHLPVHPFPELKSGRLILRQLVWGDASEIWNLRTDDSVNRYLDRPLPAGIEDARDFITLVNLGIQSGKWIYWGIHLTNEPKIAGTICLWNFSKEGSVAEIGYELLPSYHHKGLMNEAIQLVVHFGFHDLQLEVIEAWTKAQNLPSIRILERNEFKLKIPAPENGSTGISKHHVIYQMRKEFL